MTVITNPERKEVQALFLRGHCRLFKVEMTHSKMTASDLRRKVSHVTGNQYKRGEWDAMITDLSAIISETGMI